MAERHSSKHGIESCLKMKCCCYIGRDHVGWSICGNRQTETQWHYSPSHSMDGPLLTRNSQLFETHLRTCKAACDRVKLLLRGCKCVTGCTTGRCGCNKNNRRCSEGCECKNCSNIATAENETAIADLALEEEYSTSDNIENDENYGLGVWQWLWQWAINIPRWRI